MVRGFNSVEIKTDRPVESFSSGVARLSGCAGLPRHLEWRST